MGGRGQKEWITCGKPLWASPTPTTGSPPVGQASGLQLEETSPPRNIWPCVEIDVVVPAGDVLLASSE